MQVSHPPSGQRPAAVTPPRPNAQLPEAARWKVADALLTSAARHPELLNPLPRRLPWLPPPAVPRCWRCWLSPALLPRRRRQRRRRAARSLGRLAQATKTAVQVGLRVCWTTIEAQCSIALWQRFTGLPAFPVLPAAVGGGSVTCRRLPGLAASICLIVTAGGGMTTTAQPVAGNPPPPLLPPATPAPFAPSPPPPAPDTPPQPCQGQGLAQLGGMCSSDAQCCQEGEAMAALGVLLPSHIF